MIRFEDFSFQYARGTQPALKNLNLTIEDGDFVGIIGNSGAGKSTLTYAVNGVVPHFYPGDFYGSVIVEGEDTVESQPENLAKVVGSVFQDVDAQMVASVVEDELMFGLENFKVPHDQIEERIASALAQTGITDLRRRQIDSLSGGQKQKVAVAAILALRPRIIVLDEPTGELDPQSSEQIFKVLKELNETYGTTIVVVEQKVVLLCRYVQKLMLLEKGEVVQYGPLREVLRHSDEMEKIGMHVPRIVSLYKELKNRNLYSGEAPIRMEEAEEMAREAMK